MRSLKLNFKKTAKKQAGHKTARVILFFMTGLLLHCSRSTSLVLVQNGAPKSIIILPQDHNTFQLDAVKDFQHTIKRASGADIPIRISDSLDTVNHEIKIVLGPSTLTDQLGIDAGDLKEEEFRLLVRDHYLIILARDNESGSAKLQSRVTMWAFSYLLDHVVGVRWLWPGDLGTVVPPVKTIRIPALDVRFQPALVKRVFRSRKIPEYLDWAAHHTVEGSRVNLQFVHSFRANGNNGPWWDTFHQTRPELLAKNPQGKPELSGGRKDFFKMCISNPDVADEIIKTWIAAGSPDFWDMTTNDGNGFCTCDSCRALDLKYGDVRYTKEEIWHRPPHVGLTDRYVWFWNTMIRQMRQINPNATIGVQFYSAYRNPPKKLKLEDGIIGEMVHGFDFSFWEQWQAVGATAIGLRPNWWHMGGSGPHVPLHTVGAYIEKARHAGMISIDMDTMVEYWATQGPYYYLVARLIARPDLTTDDVIAEYCSAFGNAAQDIRAYLDFWEEYHKKVAYNIPAGGKLSQDSTGLYETISREKFGEVLHPLVGHWKTMPYIYNEHIISQAREILASAQGNVEPNDSETLKRILFLQHGLDQIELTNTLLLAETTAAKGSAFKALQQFGLDMQEQFGYWGSEGIWLMSHWGLIGEESKNVDGM